MDAVILFRLWSLIDWGQVIDAFGARCSGVGCCIWWLSRSRVANPHSAVSQPRQALAADIPSDWCHKSLKTLLNRAM
jgi:hypothetical protein